MMSGWLHHFNLNQGWLLSRQVLNAINRLWPLLVLSIVGGWSDFAMAQDTNSLRLESYLESLKLDRLLIKHLEREVARERDRFKRIEKARRLAQLYTSELLKAPLDSETASYWIRKSNGLLAIYPELRNSQLTLAIFQGRYLVKERAFRQWWTSADPGPRETLLADWHQLTEELSRFKSDMEVRYQELVAAVQSDSNNENLARELVQTEKFSLHSSFLLGWAAYFHGILDPGERTAWLQRSDEYFRDYLQIEPRKSLTEFSAKWFEFESGWQLRALIGLAMCHRGLGHPQQSEHCFQLIQKGATEEGQRLLFVWKLNGCLYVDQYEAAIQCVEEFNKDPVPNSAGQIAFWANALQASSAIREKNPELAKGLQLESLAGLARTMQAPLIQQAVKEQEIEFPDDFMGNWVQGYLYYYLFENSPNKLAERDQAKSFLLKALEMVDARSSKNDVARCWYLLARIYYRDRDFAAAARLFQKVATAIDNFDFAAEAQWLAAKSLIELSRVDPRQSEPAYAAIENLIRRFPDSVYARKGEFEKLKLNLASLPGDEAIRRLDRIEPRDPNFVLAAEETIRIQFRLLLDAIRAGNTDSQRRMEQLIASEKAIRDLSGVSLQSKLKSTLLVVDGLLRFEPINETQISDLLSRAAEFADPILYRNAELYAEYRYYQMLFAEKRQDLATAQQQAQWLVAHAANTRFEKVALIFLGRLLDSQISDDDDDATISEAISVFRRLVEVLGSSREAVSQSKNAQVAMRKLAELESLAGNVDEADSIYDLLVQYFPDRQQFILGRAKSSTAREDFDTALPLWRKLANNATAGTDLWYESKYNLVICLLASDRQMAGQVYRQTMRLSPEFPSKWRLPFRELEAKLDQ